MKGQALTTGQIKEIRSLWMAGYKTTDIAAAVGCSTRTVAEYKRQVSAMDFAERFDIKGFKFRYNKDTQDIHFDKVIDLRKIHNAQEFIKVAETIWSIALMINQEKGVPQDV